MTYVNYMPITKGTRSGRPAGSTSASGSRGGSVRERESAEGLTGGVGPRHPLARGCAEQVPPVQLVDEGGRKPNELGDLGLVAIDPRAARLVSDGYERVVLLPDDERALGAEDVLLPPHLSQIGARDAAPRLVRRLDLAELNPAR